MWLCSVPSDIQIIISRLSPRSCWLLLPLCLSLLCVTTQLARIHTLINALLISPVYCIISTYSANCSPPAAVSKQLL